MPKFQVGDTFRCVDCQPKLRSCNILGIVVGLNGFGEATLETLYTGSHSGCPYDVWRQSLWLPKIIEHCDWPDDVLASYTKYVLLGGVNEDA